MGALYTLAVVALPAGAACTTRDAWHGPDKNLHAVGGAFIAAAVTAQTGSAWEGWAAAALVGLAKEAADSRSAVHTCSLQDFVATAAGGAAGAAFTGWGLRLQAGGGATITYTWELK